MRICSLLPGATEVVAALGAADDLVGISHECDYPEEVRQKPVLIHAAIDPQTSSSPDIDRQVRAMLSSGESLYTLDEERFLQAQPELVITQELCHVCAVTPDQLQRAMGRLPHLPRLLTLNPTTLMAVLEDIQRIGSAIGREEEGRMLAAQLRSQLQLIRERVSRERSPAQPRPRVACLEWLAPLYHAGHWVPEMVDWAGGWDVLGKISAPSSQITWDHLIAASPDIVVIMPCGFSIDRTVRELSQLTAHPCWEKLPAVQHDRVYIVDAVSYFSRPGPRLIEGVRILAGILHPDLFGDIPATQARHLTVSWARDLECHDLC